MYTNKYSLTSLGFEEVIILNNVQSGVCQVSNCRWSTSNNKKDNCELIVNFAGLATLILSTPCLK